MKYAFFLIIIYILSYHFAANASLAQWIPAMTVEGRSEAIILVTVSVLALSTLTVILRCYTRLYIVRAFGWDDTIMITAMVCS